jgi:hypothetical protein
LDAIGQPGFDWISVKIPELINASSSIYWLTIIQIYLSEFNKVTYRSAKHISCYDGKMFDLGEKLGSVMSKLCHFEHCAFTGQ